jgi:glycosyltransferase involved in cell wall biosynthesis
VIRTRDKEKYLDRLLESLAQQSVQASEIVIVDNYSTERRRRALEKNLNEIAGKFFGNGETQLKLATLCDDDFSHAYSTNLGARAAENELVCITNAHSLPISLNWLYDGAKHFKEDNVAGVSGFFVPHGDGTVAGRLDTLLYYYSQKAASHKDWFCTMTSIIRKKLWKIYPFDENLPNLVPETKKYGLEDYDWGQEMTARGYKIVVDPLFSVFHSHTGGVDEIVRNVKNYFVYRRIQQKIRCFDRPRESFTKVQMDCASKIWP